MALLNDIGTTIGSWFMPKAKTIDYMSIGYNNESLFPTGVESGGARVSVPPKAANDQQIQNYLTQGTSWLNAIGQVISAISPKQATQVTAPIETVTLGGTPTVSAAGKSNQFTLPDNLFFLQSPTGTQGAQAAQQQDNGWIMWLVVAILIIGGLVILTKGK